MKLKVRIYVVLNQLKPKVRMKTDTRDAVVKDDDNKLFSDEAGSTSFVLYVDLARVGRSYLASTLQIKFSVLLIYYFSLCTIPKELR